MESINKPIEVNDSNFGEIVKKYPVVVVDCWAEWCAPCRMIAPIVEELARDYAGKVVFGKLNVDYNQQTAIEYGIMAIPTLLIFKNGENVDRIVGAMPRSMLESKIKKYLSITQESKTDLKGSNKAELKIENINKPIEVNDDNFEETIRKYPIVVVDCWAEWCAPCRIIAPIVEELARDYAGRIVFGKLNVDYNQLTAMQYGIMGIPTLLVFKNGENVDKIVGAMPRSMLEPRIKRYL